MADWLLSSFSFSESELSLTKFPSFPLTFQVSALNTVTVQFISVISEEQPNMRKGKPKGQRAKTFVIVKKLMPTLHDFRPVRHFISKFKLQLKATNF